MKVISLFPKRLVKDCLIFFIVMMVVFPVIDLFRGKTMDGPYFLNLFGKSVFIAVFWLIGMRIFVKSYRETRQE